MLFGYWPTRAYIALVIVGSVVSRVDSGRTTSSRQAALISGRSFTGRTVTAFMASDVRPTCIRVLTRFASCFGLSDTNCSAYRIAACSNIFVTSEPPPFLSRETIRLEIRIARSSVVSWDSAAEFFGLAVVSSSAIAASGPSELSFWRIRAA